VSAATSTYQTSGQTSAAAAAAAAAAAVGGWRAQPAAAAQRARGVGQLAGAEPGPPTGALPLRSSNPYNTGGRQQLLPLTAGKK
jgi:hypothetical protein